MACKHFDLRIFFHQKPPGPHGTLINAIKYLFISFSVFQKCLQSNMEWNLHEIDTKSAAILGYLPEY
jgi:hypothetical protein